MSEKPIPITRPVLGEREADAARRAILSGWVTQGPEVAAFEQEFAATVGSPYACAVSSCTAALHTALLACGVGPGDEVVTVSHSFIASANSIRYCGATPVFVDIQPGTFNMCPEHLEASLTPRTRAILCVHQMGMPCDLAAIVALARRRSRPLIEDAACAAGSEIRFQDGAWERIGKPHGDVACFSFHPRKLITTGEGGMLTTADPELDRRFRRSRQHGMSVSDSVRHGSSQVIFESYEELGYNYRMSDIQAAIGRAQLARLPEIVAKRRTFAERYRDLLTDVPGLTLPEEPAWARSNWQSYCVRLTDRSDQREVMQRLLDRGISTRRGIMCAHREPAYSAHGWVAGPGGLLESERAQDQNILLPLFHDMTETEQDRVAREVRRAIGDSIAS